MSTPVGGVFVYAKAGEMYTMDGSGNEILLGNALVNPMTTLGDIVRGAAGGAPQRLAIGATGTVLTVVAGVPAWGGPATFSTTVAITGNLTVGASTFVVTAATGAVTTSGAINGLTLLTSNARALFQYSNPGPTEYGLGNAALGSGSGAALDLNLVTGAYHNAFYGGESGTATTTGYQNTFLGHRAGTENTTGALNTFVGQGAGYESLTASSSVHVGFHAGLNVVGTGANVFVGASAGAGVAGGTATASGSVIVGQNAGFGITTGIENTIVGYQAAFALTTSAKNTLIGTRAGWGANGTEAITTAGSNLVCIGYEAIPTTPTGSNEVTLGNASITNFRVPGVGFSVSTTAAILGGSLAITGALTGVTTAAISGDIVGNTNKWGFLGTTGALGVGALPTATSVLHVVGLPVAAAGLAAGDVWSNAGVLTIV